MWAGASAAAILATLIAPSFAANWQYTREAESGKPKMVWNYGNWNAKCEERGGVVTVLSKPQHGTLSRQRAVQHIRSNRINPTDHCIGRDLPGLAVTYTSARGFHGTDSFVIQRTFPTGRIDVDTFTMQVK